MSAGRASEASLLCVAFPPYSRGTCYVPALLAASSFSEDLGKSLLHSRGLTRAT